MLWRSQRKAIIITVLGVFTFTVLFGDWDATVGTAMKFLRNVKQKRERPHPKFVPLFRETMLHANATKLYQGGHNPLQVQGQSEGHDEPIMHTNNFNRWQTHIKDQCEKLGIYDPLTERNLDTKLFKHILVDDKHKTIYCQIPKVATMTWRRIFIISTGKSNETDPKDLMARDIYGKYDDILQYLSDLPPEEIKYKLKHYFKFMFVREPMERLLSAFRNKMLQTVKSSDYFRKTLGQKIAQEYRPLPKTKSIDPNNPGVQFKEFVQYLTDPHRRVPWNEHWDKYHHLCFPCTIQYDFVGRLEYSQRDANYVLEKTGLDEIALFPNRSDTNYKLKETKDILKKFYSTLTISDLRNLVQEYEIDRRLFGYRLPDIIKDFLHRD